MIYGLHATIDREVPTLSYYLVAYLDVLGQAKKLRRLERLPKTPEEERQTVETLAETALTVKKLRENFDHHFGCDAPSADAAAMVPPEHREEFRRAFGVQPWYRGFSDSVVITVPLTGRDEIQRVAALVAVHRALYSISAVMLNFLATAGIAIRGGVDVGLAARGKSPTAFNRCCIPPRGVAPQSNTPSILPRRALGPGPRTGLDATPDFHHGLLGIELFKEEFYGRALVEAYELESQKAKYPRALVGSGLLDYLSAMDEAPYSSPRLRALAKSTVEDCRQLLLTDPEDGLLAIDILQALDDTEQPAYQEILALCLETIRRVDGLARTFDRDGDDRLAGRYRRLSRLLAQSPRFASLTGSLKK